MEIVKLLVSKGARVGLYLTLVRAMSHGWVDIVKMIGEESVCTDISLFNPADFGKTNLLLERDCQMDLQDSTGRSALIHASK